MTILPVVQCGVGLFGAMFVHHLMFQNVKNWDVCIKRRYSALPLVVVVSILCGNVREINN